MSTQPLVPTAPNTDLATIRSLFEAQQAQQWELRKSTAQERIKKLNKLYKALLEYQEEVEAAIWNDFRKSKTETILSELGVVLAEIRFATKRLKGWMRPKAVGTPLSLFGASSEIWYEPKGVCLILAPWNFPFNLSFAPLVSAIAAGNCVILKPSEYAVHSSALIRKLVEMCFDPREVAVVEGDAGVAQALLDLPFNHLFFTGSPSVGKLVQRAAAQHLASVTLELGGKSPVIVDETADLNQAASKIAWLKAMNAGQICIAPDYILVHESVKAALVEKIGQYWSQFFGKDAAARAASPDLCRLVNARHFQRIKGMLEDAKEKGATVAYGGNIDLLDNYVEPTLLLDAPMQAAVWQEEIFGPLLPIRSYTSLDTVVAEINAQPAPLALYIFSKKNKVVNRLLRDIRCGGATVNDCGPHFYNAELPFGGVNNSGIGNCHGYFGFLEFSNQRGIVRQSKVFPTTDLMLPPYGNRLSKWLLKGILRWF